MTVYMEVTLDKYELPVAIADTARELAALRKTTSASIYSTICHAKEGKLRSKYVKVQLED